MTIRDFLWAAQVDDRISYAMRMMSRSTIRVSVMRLVLSELRCGSLLMPAPQQPHRRHGPKHKHPTNIASARIRPRTTHAVIPM